MEQLNRRDFLRRSAGAAAFGLLGGQKLWAAPNGKLRVAVVGIGGMGHYAISTGLKEQVVAVCDIDDNTIAGVMTKTIQPKLNGAPEPKVYYDYRKLLDECHQDLDVVLISTPDHDHGPAAIRAINHGLHVFCQKPLCHNIREVELVSRAARDKGVLTQMGNQGHCGENLRRACEYLQGGAIGEVYETHTVLGRNFGGTGDRPAAKPVPQNVHWDEWLGPAPERPFQDGLHPFSWRSWRDFGTGTIGDMACHNLDCLYFALQVREAKTFTVECLNTNSGSAEMWAQSNIVKYTIPARGSMPQLESYVYDNADLRPDVVKQTEAACDLKFGEGTLYIGQTGIFYTGGTAGSAMVLPMEKKKLVGNPERTLPRAHGGPIDDLFWAIKNSGVPASNFPEAAGPLTSFVLTGHLAQYAGVGNPVEWDVDQMACTNRPELNVHVGRTYRKGWEV